VAWETERFRVPVAARADGEAVTLAVRPEKLTLCPAGAPADGNRLEGVVEVVTFLGPVVRAEVSVHGRSIWVDLPHALAGGIERKKRVTLTFAAADCVVLDGQDPADR
jgi:ABC-type Fe3+/spermidine/putrescine transport system ATPase subunit